MNNNIPFNEEVYIYIRRYYKEHSVGLTFSNIATKFGSKDPSSVKAILNGMVKEKRVDFVDNVYIPSSLEYKKASKTEWADIATYLI